MLGLGIAVDHAAAQVIGALFRVRVSVRVSVRGAVDHAAARVIGAL